MKKLREQKPKKEPRTEVTWCHLKPSTKKALIELGKEDERSIDYMVSLACDRLVEERR